MTQKTLAEVAPTPEEELANWQMLYDEFRKATPSSPAWYQLADYCIGVLMHDKINSLKIAISPQQQDMK